MACRRGHMVYIGLYREKHEIIFLSETTRTRALIFGMKHYLASGPLPSLFKLYPWAKNGRALGVTCKYICLYRENHEKIFLSETTRPRALMCSMKHHLVNHYQVFFKLHPWGQKWPDPWLTCFYIGLYKEKHEKNLLVCNHKA